MSNFAPTPGDWNFGEGHRKVLRDLVVCCGYHPSGPCCWHLVFGGIWWEYRFQDLLGLLAFIRHPIKRWKYSRFKRRFALKPKTR